MVATSHALIGGAIAASSATNPALGLSLAFVSHPLLDLLPHWDFGFNWRTKTKIRLFIEAFLDLGTGTVLAYVLFGQKLEPWYFWGTIFLSEVWDITEAPYWFFKWDFPPFSSVYNIQHKMQNKLDLPWGIVTQIATVLGAIFLSKLLI